MGNQYAGYMNAFQKERLGWLPSSQVVTTTGTYHLSPLALTTAPGPFALKILKSTDTSGRRVWYYLEYRTQIGWDMYVLPGVVVHTGNDVYPNTSFEEDLQPLSATFDATLDAGQSFADAALGLTITTVSTDATGASIAIQIGASAAPKPSGKPLIHL